VVERKPQPRRRPAKPRTTVTKALVDSTEIRDAARALRAAPPEIRRLAADVGGRVASWQAGRLRAAALADSPQSALVAASIVARRGAVPKVRAGGDLIVATHGGGQVVPASAIVFGAEFGGRRRLVMNADGARVQLRGKRRTAALRHREALAGQGIRLTPTTLQFRQYQPDGYWLFPTLVADAPARIDMWSQGLRNLIDTLWADA